MNESIKYWPELLCRISAMISHIREYDIPEVQEGLTAQLAPKDIEAEIWRSLKRFAKENELGDISMAIEKLKWDSGPVDVNVESIVECEDCGKGHFCLTSKDDGKRRCRDCERDRLFGKTIVDPFLCRHG